jgi:hypothetical protein
MVFHIIIIIICLLIIFIEKKTCCSNDYFDECCIISLSVTTMSILDVTEWIPQAGTDLGFDEWFDNVFRWGASLLKQ